MSKKFKQEKRMVHRLEMNLPVVYKISDVQGLPVASTLNVSAIGICLLSKQGFKVGQELVIQMTLPPEEEAKAEDVEFAAEVIWIEENYVEKKDGSVSREYKAGLKLLGGKKSHQKKFVQFFAKQFLAFFKDRKS